MSPALSIPIIKRARKLLRCGKLTHCEFAVLDALVWCCRSPTSGTITVSYITLARLACCARSTIARAVSTLERLRLITRVRRYALFPWACGGRQARRLCNSYVLNHRSDSATANYSDSIYITVPPVSQYSIEAAKAALLSRRRDIERRLAMK
jgi:hypothetical protein